MTKVSIETTQNVEIDYEAATAGERVLAHVLDYVVFFVYLIVVSVVFGILHINAFDGYFGALIIMLPILLYDLLIEYLTGGRSVGKLIMGLKVVRLDGTQPTLSNYVTRWITRLIDSPSGLTIPMGVGWLGFLTVLTSEKGQRLGDIAAGTSVVKMSRRTRLFHTILHHQIHTDYQPVFPQVAHLNDIEIAEIKALTETIRRTQNVKALNALAVKLKTVLDVKSNLPDIQFIYTVMKDYSNYNFQRT